MPGRTRSGVAVRRGALLVREAHQVDQVGALGVVELEGTTHGVHDILGDAARVAAFESRVPLDADPGHKRDFLAPEPCHSAMPSEGG